jgi:hypothetical protein
MDGGIQMLIQQGGVNITMKDLTGNTIEMSVMGTAKELYEVLSNYLAARDIGSERRSAMIDPSALKGFIRI